MVCGSTRTLLESGTTPAEVMDLVPVKPLAEMEAQISERYRTRLPAYALAGIWATTHTQHSAGGAGCASLLSMNAPAGAPIGSGTNKPAKPELSWWWGIRSIGFGELFDAGDRLTGAWTRATII